MSASISSSRIANAVVAAQGPQQAQAAASAHRVQVDRQAAKQSQGAAASVASARQARGSRIDTYA